MNPSNDSSLRQLDAAWRDSLRRRGHSPKTVASYAAATINLQRFLNRRQLLDARWIKPGDLAAWQQSLSDRAPSTREQYARIVGYWFQWLVLQGKLFRNPAANLRQEKRSRQLVRCPTEEEVRRLLHSIKGRDALAVRNRALLELSYGTGARRAELARLRVDSVRLDTGLVLLHGKGDRDRMVPLTRPAIQSIARYLQQARRLLLGTYPDHGVLFVGIREGRPLGPFGVAQVLASTARRVGLRLTPHDLRRAFASHLIRGGAQPAQVMELLGHQTYRHLGRYLQSCRPRLTPPDRRKSL